ncbi:MAG: Hint domain-containing protein [Pseudomonadota bacterium]
MATYSIYVLQESDVTLSGGAILDGVNQGDGSHLVDLANPITLTLNSRSWIEAQITDDDTDFRDNDSGQQLGAPLTLDGVTFAVGARVEAEYSFTVTDGTSTWTVIAFNVNNSNPAYGTVEGLAFVGDEGGFPPTGVALEITAAFEGPNFDSSAYAFPICFTAGTQIDVPGGLCRVEDLRSGDLVETLGYGAEPLVWAGRRRVAARGRFAPVEFAPGTIGNTRALRLSQQHRLQVTGAAAELYFGTDAVLVPARAYLGRPGVRLVQTGTVDYVHIMFAAHRVVWAEGAAAESFFPGQTGLSSLDSAARSELLALFPELSEGSAAYGLVANPCLSMRESAAMLAL